MRIRKAFIRLCLGILASALVRRRFSPERLNAVLGASGLMGQLHKLRRDPAHKVSSQVRDAHRKRFWIHAASVGELESLWTLIECLSDRGDELIITVFSESAGAALTRLHRDLVSRGAKLLYVGYSPWEGLWSACLESIRPDVFITAKYEAWPELWVGLGYLGIPIAIIGAKARFSFGLAAFVCRLAGVEVPQVQFLVASQVDVPVLQKSWPAASVLLVGEPRWDRVFARNLAGSQRSRELISKYAWLPRPWGVFGSAWASDLDFWDCHIQDLPGTLWLVPHHIDEATIALLEGRLLAQRFAFVRSRGGPELKSGGAAPRAVIVNEMGFLSELYSSADWAYVGGGFQAGVHSTIEPAIHGLPICVGPKRADRFSEISDLVSTGQLTILRTAVDLEQWMARLSEKLESREEWRIEAQGRLGATGRALAELDRLMLSQR